MIVDCAVYAAGQRRPGTWGAQEARVQARACGGFVWIGLHEPTEAEFDEVAGALGLHPLAVEDAIHARQRPKLERYDDSLFVVLKPARYVDAQEVVEVAQILVFLGRDFVVTVRHGATRALSEVRRALEADPERLEWGPGAVLYAVADRVADDYAEVVTGLGDDVDQIEEQVFGGPRPTHAERIFKLKREVLDFRRAVEPLEAPLAQLAAGVAPVDERLNAYFRDVHDHVLRVAEQLTGLDALLDSALHANVAQVGMRQNEDMRKISAWVAIIALPTLVAGLYGMNFEHIPELGWQLGYPFALAVMALGSGALYVSFKRRGWL